MTVPLQAARLIPEPPRALQVTETLDLMLRLADLLSHETDLVRRGRIQDIEPLQKEKLRLSQLYQQAVKALQAGGAQIAALPTSLRAQIVAASGRLADTVGENERVLRIGRTATRKLLDMVVDSIKARMKPLNRYNAKLTAIRHAPALVVAVDRRM
jgi:hypothetical protein